MKMHTLLSVLALLGVSTLVGAQGYTFKVLANKGINEVKAGDVWAPLKTGAVLNAGDQLKLGDNAYIGLVHSTGKPVEVKEAGTHSVADLEKRVPAGSSVLNKYADFILSSNSSESRNRLSATGAVHRGDGDEAPINVLLPETDNTGTFNKIAIINWEVNEAKGPYVVTVKNMFEDILESVETSGTSYRLDLNDKKYAQETAILIEVSSKKDPALVSKRHMIKTLSPAELEEVASALQLISSHVSEETAVNKAMIAGFYENHNLLIDAIYAYEQAVKLEPDAYRAQYDAFLKRHNLK